MVHRDLKLENILLSKNPSDSSDTLYIKVSNIVMKCMQIKTKLKITKTK